MRRFLLLLLSFLLGGQAFAQNTPSKASQRAISFSQQFVVYCHDPELRIAVSNFSEAAKATTLETLGLQDQWKLPIVINLEQASTTNPTRPLCSVRIFVTEEGPSIAVDLTLRESDFKEARFPQQLVRAILLELIYRNVPIKEGEHYAEPPTWLVEGITERLFERTTQSAPNAALFKQLINTGRIPRIRDFLGSNVEAMDSTSRTIYGAFCASLIDMLSSLPNGKQHLASLAQELGKSQGDSIDLLLATFPTLGGNESTLEKWWTLGLARQSTLDRYSLLSIDESVDLITPLLTLKWTDPTKTEQSFTLDQFPTFLKLKGVKAALTSQSHRFTEILPKIHPLFRPLVIEYQRVCTDLSRGRTKRIAETLTELSHYQRVIVERMDQITDYMNWYEVTQVTEWSGTFDEYLRAAKKLGQKPVSSKNDPITRYIDQIEREFD